MSSALSSQQTHDPYRRLIYTAIGCICKQSGFDGVTKSSLETLTELMQAHLNELTRSCRKFSELGHRTSPDLTDVKMALADIGSSVYGVHFYSKRTPTQPLRPLNPTKLPPEHKALKPTLSKVNHPSYIPNHFPDYPDVHAFVRTPTLREPMNQYQTVRERVANQKEATEESLVKFLSQADVSNDNVGIFENIDGALYPSINSPLDPYVYLKALLPPANNDKDHINQENENNENVKAEINIDSDGSQPNSFQPTLSTATSSPIDCAYLREPKRLKNQK